MGLAVAGKAAVVHEPAEGPLHNPAPGNHLETLVGRVAAGDFDVDAEAGAVVEDFGAVAGVGPSFRGSGHAPPRENASPGTMPDAACHYVPVVGVNNGPHGCHPAAGHNTSARDFRWSDARALIKAGESQAQNASSILVTRST